MADPRPTSETDPPRQLRSPPWRRGQVRRAGVRGSGTPSAPTATATPAGARWWNLPRPLRWVGAILALLVLALAIFLMLFQWNWLRGPIDGWASSKMHRQVTIHGDLTGKLLTWTPSLTARDVTVAEPAWRGAGAAPMSSIPQLTIAIDLKALMGGRLIIARVDAEHPFVHLARDAGGRNNWTFGPTDVEPSPLRLPAIRNLVINDGRMVLDDARRNLHFTGQVSTNEQLTGYGRGSFSLTGQGSLNGAPFSAVIGGGPLINVDPDKPYPFRGDVHAGATHIVAAGSLQRPFDLGVLQVSGRITGQDMSDLYQLTGLPLPSSPPFDVTGELARNGDVTDITHIGGRIGSSDLSGHLRIAAVNGRPDLTGDLASRQLKLADVTPMLGGAPRGMMRGAVVSPAQAAAAARLTAEHRILPDARLDVSRMRMMDADVGYRAESVDAGPLPIRQVSLHARLDHGLLTIDPLSLTLPQGGVSGSLRLDARGATPVTSINLALAHAQVQELLPRVLGQPPAEGVLVASARLTGAGASVREAAGNASGTVTVAMPGGQMRQLFAEVMGVDVAKSLFLYLSKDQTPTPIRCAVADFRAQAGVMNLQRLVIDTAAVQATGQGSINLRDETLDIAISGKPKHFRFLHIAAPITLKGRFDDPKLGIDVAKAAPQLALGAALGVIVAPLAAVLPFVAGGTAKDADCGALLAEAQGLGAPLGR